MIYFICGLFWFLSNRVDDEYVDRSYLMDELSKTEEQEEKNIQNKIITWRVLG